MEAEKAWSDYSYADEVKGFWEEAREYNYKKGNIRTDCDARSVRLYEQMRQWLDGRVMPDGQILHLKPKGKHLLEADGIRLSGDNIFTRFTGRVPALTDRLEAEKGAEWESFQQRIIRKGWTIGGEILFPCHRNSLNGMRGFSRKVMDRFDLTLECIQRFYESAPSPLDWVLEADREWFAHFRSFPEFIDFFLLNDWVDDSYQVTDQLATGHILPQTVSELENWLLRMEWLVSARNARLEACIRSREDGPMACGSCTRQ